MAPLFSTPVSVYRTALATEGVPVQLGNFLRANNYGSQIQQLRAITDKAGREQLKKQLPAATISGTFRRRKAEEIETYNGLICLDFDAKDNPGLTPAEMKRRLAEFEEVAYAGLSCSGTGVFAIVPTTNTDPAHHAAVVDSLGKLLAGEGLVYDRACKDVCRLRFVSWDPEAHWAGAPKLLDVAPFIQAPAPTFDPARKPRPLVLRDESPAKERAGRGGRTTREKVEDYVKAIESGCADITQNYDDWVKLGFALAAEFGTEGEDFFQRISQFHPQYDQAEVAKKYAELTRKGSRVRIGSFFRICQDQGIKL